MSATILAFPCAPAGPCRLTPATRNALIAFGAERPRWEISFAACDDGDEYAAFGDTFRDGDTVFMVAAMPGGRLGIIEDDETWPERFTTGAEVVAVLRRAGL